MGKTTGNKTTKDAAKRTVKKQTAKKAPINKKGPAKVYKPVEKRGTPY